MDGFTASLLVRRAIRNYLVDTKGNGLVANAFITKSWVKSSQVQFHINNNDRKDMKVFQVLTFRSGKLTLKTLSIIGSCVNLGCTIAWAVLFAFEGGVVFKWNFTQSRAPSKVRVAVIMEAIIIGFVMDCFHLCLGRLNKWYPLNRGDHKKTSTNVRETSEDTKRVRIIIVCIVIIIEIVCIVLCNTVVWRMKHVGSWIYSALHGLVWIKWVIRSYLLGEILSKHESDPVTTTEYEKYPTQGRRPRWTDNGILVYSYAFLLNAILDRVRGKWDYVSSSKDN